MPQLNTRCKPHINHEHFSKMFSIVKKYTEIVTQLAYNSLLSFKTKSALCGSPYLYLDNSKFLRFSCNQALGINQFIFLCGIVNDNNKINKCKDFADPILQFGLRSILTVQTFCSNVLKLKRILNNTKEKKDTNPWTQTH